MVNLESLRIERGFFTEQQPRLTATVSLKLEGGVSAQFPLKQAATKQLVELALQLAQAEHPQLFAS